MWGHLYDLHPTTWQQHHLQVEQVCCQVACGLGDVKAHSREDRTYRKKQQLCAAASAPTMSHTTAKIKLYPCCLAIISRRDFMVFIEDTETNRDQITHQ